MQKLIWKSLGLSVMIMGVFFYTHVFANIANIDPFFDTKVPVGFDMDIMTMAVQSDGKILMGGMFSSYQGISANKIIRLNLDGTKDSSFSGGAGFSQPVNAIAIQSDGKIVVGGSFASYQGLIVGGIVRLHADGSRDTGFTMGAGFNIGPRALAVQNDGKIIAAGEFSTYSGALSVNRIIRLNANGTRDTSFNIGAGFDFSPSVITIQTDGKILVGGQFSTYSGVSANRIIRLNTDGTRDSSFIIGSGFNNPVEVIAIQSDGKILIAGDFSTYSGVSANKIIRLNTDGTKDVGFVMGSGFNSVVTDIYVQSGGTIVAGGMFTNYNGITANSIISLNPDGTIDPAFISGGGFNMGIGAMGQQNDGKIIAAGYFSTYNGLASTRLIRLNVDGTKDNSFVIGNGFNYSILALAMQSDGKMVVGGIFTTYSGGISNYIERLNDDGSKDTGFNAGTGFNLPVNTIAIQSDGKIIVGGQFTSYSGVRANEIIRLNTDGTRDSSFFIGSGFDSQVKAITIQNDGKILVGGEFYTYSGVSARGIIRLNTDGTRDSSFVVGNGFIGGVNSISLQSDGKIIVGGNFSSYSGVTSNSIVRLSTTGSRDTTFVMGNGFNGGVFSTAIQSDGKVIAGGIFSTYSGASVSRIVRLSSTGLRDSSFVIGNGFNSIVKSIAIQTNGKIVVGGEFTTYNSAASNYIVRLNSAGTNDSSFVVASGFNNYVQAVAVQPNNGKIYVGGQFTTYNGVAAGYLVSLYGDSDVVILPNSTDTSVVVTEFTNKGYVQASGDLVGSKAISLGQTNGNIPLSLNLKNQDIKLTIPAETQFKKADNVIPYNGIVSVPIVKSMGSVDDEQVISSFKVGSSSESIRLAGGVATLSVPASGKNIGDLVQIYYSEDNGVTWYPQTMGFVTSQNGEPYVSFTTNHFTDFAVTIPSGSFTGTFVINSDDVSTLSTGVTLAISVAPVPTFMRFSNDGITRSAREAYSTSRARSLGTGYGEKTVYIEFDTNGDGIYDIQTSDVITYLAPWTMTYSKPAGTMTNSDVIATLTLNESGSIVGTGIYTFTGNGTHAFDYFDATGYAHTAIATVTWIDKIAPVVTMNGVSPIYVEYGTVYTEMGALWSDNNDGGGVVTSISGSVNTSILGTHTITYTKVDAAGNTGTIDRTVIVSDTTAPVVTLNGAATIYVEYGSVYTELGATWTDLRDGAGAVSSISGSVNTGVLGTYTLTYSKVDVAGNTGTISRSVVVRDTTAPVVTLNGASTIYVEYGSAYTELGATWIDLYDGTGPATISGSVNTGTLGTYTLTYSKVDAAGNTGTINRSVIVRDTTAPVVTLNGASTIYVEYGNAYTELGATWTDLRDGTAAVNVISGSVNTGVLGTYTLTYSKVDAAGNTGTINRSVIVRDTTAPVVTLNGAATIYVEYGSVYTELGATWIDLYDGTGPATISGSVNTGTFGTYTLTYSKVDAAGNTGNTITRTVTVRDTTAPMISEVTLTPTMVGGTAEGTITQTISDFNGVNAASANLVGPDGFTDTVTLSLVSGDMHNGVRSGIYTFPAQDTAHDGVYYISGNATDLANNTGYHEIGQIILDRTAPTFSMISITPNYVGITGLVTINVSAQDMTVGISGIDIRDITSDVPASLTSGTAFPTDPEEMGSWVFTQSVTTGEGIHIEEITTTDIVGNTRTATGSFLYDITAPIVTLNGATPIYIEFNSSYIESGATWADDVDGTGTANTISGSVNTLLLGNYEILYSQSDRAGNVGTATRVVIVRDTTAPIVTLNGASIIYVEYGANYIESGATWADLHDGSGDAIISGSIDTGTLGTYILEYWYADSSLNTGDSVYRTVIVRDTTAPVVTLNGAATIYVEYGNAYTELGATWTDLHDGSGDAIISGSVATGTLGTYILGYWYADSSLNTGDSVPRTVIVRDTTAPIATIDYSPGSGTITSGNVVATISLNESGTVISGNIYIFTGNGEYTFQFEDIYGNTGEAIASVNWIENSIPNIPTISHNSSPFPIKDQCPQQRDCSDSYYDSICGKCSPSLQIHGAPATKSTPSIVDSPFSTTLNNAYIWAYTYSITTMPTIQKANMQGKLVRKDMAKMIGNFALNILEKDVSTGVICTFADMQDQPKETQYYAIVACRLGLMGYNNDGTTLQKNFNPNQEVDRGQFGTILSRLLRGAQNNGGSTYYLRHLNALNKAGIMTKIDTPKQKEMRGRVMLMMQRIFEQQKN